VLAAPLSSAELEFLFSAQIVPESVVEWRESDGGVTSVRRDRLGALVLSESTHATPDDEAIAEALLGRLTSNRRMAIRWSVDASRIRARLAFLHAHIVGWPDVGDAALARTAREWLLPHLVGLRRQAQVDALDFSALLLSRLSWEQRTEFDALAPAVLEVPSGSRVRVDYSDPSRPVLAVRIQELFGLTATPSVAQGMVPVTLHLLSPANRPVQITKDLVGFWRNSYFEVRRELRGRYPKHDWPEDPEAASPTRRPRRHN
jgi:ATP-dependent helicase HrpB